MREAGSALLERSRAAFKADHAEAWRRLEAIGEPVSTVVESDGRPDNIQIGGTDLYPIPAHRWGKMQLEGFFEQPDRIVFSNPYHCNLSPISIKLYGRLTEFLRKKEWVTSLTGLPVVDVGYVFVFGIGLGYHIPDLIEKTTARHVILIEPVIEFLRHSLAAIDWDRVFARAEERGITIHFVLESHPQEICRVVETIILIHGNTFLDGSFHCPHYYSWALKESFALLKERLKHLYVSCGFFEDEIEMIRNTHENFKKWSFHLLEGKPFLEQKVPAFVVGSGPSLDKDIVHLKKWAGHAVIFSCGTALRPLLKNGIRPDFHVELEREEVIPGILARLDDEYGLDGIRLVASTTIWSDVARLFDLRWFFYRSVLSPTSILNDGAAPLSHADPLVTNAGFAAAAKVGFTEIYLFGIDCGVKEIGLHHSKDSAYFLKENLRLEEEVRGYSFDRVIPGNFGGMVRTFWMFDLGRRLLSEAQRRSGGRTFNCADGARIPGADPKAAAAIKFAGGPINREAVFARIERQMRRFEAGGILKEFALERHIEGCSRFIAEFPEMIAEAQQSDANFWEFEKRLNDFRNANDAEMRGYFALTGGSISSMLRLAAFFGNRIKDADKRLEFFLLFLDLYRELCVEMAERAIDLLTDVRKDKADFEASLVRAPA